MSAKRKFKGVLKLTKIFLPATILVTGLTMYLIGNGIQIDANDQIKYAKEAILKSPECVKLANKELDLYWNKLDNGEISPSEYYKRQEYLQTIDYVDDIIKAPELSEQKKELDEVEKKQNTRKEKGKVMDGFGNLASIAGIVYSAFYYGTLGGPSTAEEDWKDALNYLHS